jgi:hypothetical protein
MEISDIIWRKIMKMPLSTKYPAYALIVLICISLLVGCQNQQKIEDPKAVLARTAEEYWTKRWMDRDYEATYNMEAEKGSIPFEKYKGRIRNAGQINYLGIKTKEVKIENDKGTVDLIVRCRIANIPKDVEMPLTDNWVLKSHRWKHILRKRP